MNVCRPSRPTSWRPCLMSSIARPYRILSGSAVLSALVDLFTFFFLCRIWASHVVAVIAASPPANTSMLSRFPVLFVKAWNKLAPLLINISPECVLHHLARTAGLGSERSQYTLNERTGQPQKMAVRPGSPLSEDVAT